MTQTASYDDTKTLMFREAVYQLPGAMQLNSSAVVRVLRTAIRVHGDDAAEDVSELPAAADISTADEASLLHEAFAQPAARSIEYILDDIMVLPAFDQLNSAEVAQLLHAAAQHFSDGDELEEYDGLTVLCELAAAQELSSEQVLPPLQLVVRHSHKCTDALCKLPAVRQLSSDAVAQLLQAAIAGKSERSFKLLCELPAVHMLSSEAAAQLLQAAIAGENERSTELLCAQPAVQQPSSEAATQLLQAAIAGDSKAALVVCSCASCQQLHGSIARP
jgi:hypothetical protein